MAATSSTLNVLQRLSLVEGRLARLEDLFLLAPPPVELGEERPAAMAAETLGQAADSGRRPPVAAAAALVAVQPQRFDVERRPAPKPAAGTGSVEAARRWSGLSLESLVGGRFFAVLGALGTVIGLALFLKLAYDEGWLGRIGPVWRCLCGAATGVGLLVTGEIVRKRLGTWASAGISAAGVAALYASGFAAFTIFHLIDMWTAFALLGVASGVGVAIGARSRRPALSILSLIGAYIVPFVLKVHPTSPYVMPAYLLALLGVGLSLASWLRGGFRSVGALAYVATLLIGSVWVLSRMRQDAPLVLGFLAGVWALVHAALLFATRERAVDPDAPAFLPVVRFWRTGVLLGSFIATAWCVFLAAMVLREATRFADWYAPLAGVGVTGLIAIALCGHLRLFIERPNTEREFLGAGLLTQAGALLIGCIAMAASGTTQLYLWLGLGIAGALAGRWTGSKAVRVYGLVLLSIATLRLGTIDALMVKRLATVDVYGLMLTRWSMHCALAAVAWVIASISPIEFKNGRQVRLTPGASVVAFLLGIACVLHPESSMGSIAVWWTILGAALAMTFRRGPWFVMAEAGIALLMAGLLLAVRAATYSMPPSIDFGGLQLSVWSAQVTFVGASWALFACLIPSRDRGWPIIGAGIALLCMAVSVLHPESDSGNVALTWTVLGALAIGGSRLIPRLSLGSAGSLLVIAAAIPWARTYVPWVGGDWHSSGASMALHPGLWRAALIGLALAWARRRGRKESPDSSSPRNAIGLVGAALACVLMWCATSFEVARAARTYAENQQTQLAAVSMWWGVLGMALIVAGFLRAIPIARHAGLTLMALAAVKVVAYDLANVPAMWRVVSFLLLGLLMLGVALVYARLNSRAARNVPVQADGDMPKE